MVTVDNQLLAVDYQLLASILCYVLRHCQHCPLGRFIVLLKPLLMLSMHLFAHRSLTTGCWVRWRRCAIASSRPLPLC